MTDFYISDFLTSLFSELNNHDICYCILRNYDQIPYDTGKSDIDIFIHPKDFDTFHVLLKKITSEHNGNIISLIQTTTVKMVATYGISNHKWWGVRFDTFKYIGTNECTIFTNEYIAKRIVYHNNVKVLNEDDAAIIGLIKECLGAQKYSERYSRRAINAYQKNPSAYNTEFQKVLRLPLVENILIPLLTSASFFSKKICRELYLGYRINKFKGNPFNFLINEGKNFIYKIGRLLKTPGVSIAFLGTDGSGKSTIINSIIPILEVSLHSKILYSHMRPNMVPNIAQLLGKPKTEGPTVNPHNNKQSGFVPSLVKLIYYLFDYTIGYWLKVHPSIARKTTAWIFDRYYYDYFIDQKRAGIKLPLWIISFFKIFVPTPEIIICLGTNPEIIHKRKPELPLPEVHRQVTALQNFVKHNSRAVWVDTGCSIEESGEAVLNYITKAMSQRY